jgi:spore germination protein YaaH
MKRFKHTSVSFCDLSIRFCKQVMICAVLSFFCFFGVAAQSQEIPPARIVLADSVKFADSVRQGLINKIVQPFRFKENQTRKERERVVDLLRKLATDGDMAIDSVTVNTIANDLILLTDSLAATRGTTQFLQKEIERALINLDSKAPKEVVDSIQVQLGSVLQGLMDETKAANTAARKKLLEKLSDLRQIQFACGSDGVRTLQDTVGDSLVVSYQKCLIPIAKQRIFGWHSPTKNQAVQNYNLNYLTDLILYGYELGANGAEVNPKSLTDVIQGGILEKNQSYGKAISLSVFTASESVVSAFLNNKTAQEKFFSRIKSLIVTHKFNGINIYFEQIQPKDNRSFSDFIGRLKSELLKLDQNQLLTISVPPISNTRNLEMASKAYNFELLNADVNFYLVQTQRLNITATRIPFSMNPLYPAVSKNRGSIEETFSFYLNGKIRTEKLVMTVGYDGISWPMPDFKPGTLANGFGSTVNYKTVQETIVSTIGQQNGAVMGYDSEQASAYINYGSLGNLRQLWFNDSQSLADKYSWALDNAIGGVAIWGLGGDDGYTELWDVLGATLLEIDSITVNKEVIEKPKIKKGLSLWDYFKIYRNDIQWASVNDIYVGDPSDECYCYFEEYPSGEQIDSVARILSIGDFWDYFEKFKPYKGSVKVDDMGLTFKFGDDKDEKEYYAISSSEVCLSLLGRWNRYTEIFELTSIVLVIILLISTIILLLGIKRHGEDWGLRGIFLGISIGSGLLSIVALFFYFFFNTQIIFIGAGSSEVSVWVMISIFVLGILAGLIINKLRMAKKFSYHDLP